MSLGSDGIRKGGMGDALHSRASSEPPLSQKRPRIVETDRGSSSRAVVGGVWQRWILVRENKRLADLEDDDVILDERQMKRLQKTADMEGVDMATARQQRRGFRYLI